MIDLDLSQRRAVALDPGRHARILGAPGTGKTRVLVEVYARAFEAANGSDDAVLALAPNRIVAGRLRSQIERRLGRALGGTPVRTPAAFGYSVLARAAALEGREAPRLLTGTAQDEAIAAVVDPRVDAGETVVEGLASDVLRSQPFRDELREFWRICDDLDVDPEGLGRQLVLWREEALGEARSEAPDPGLIDRWDDARRLLVEVEGRLAESRPGELSASAMQRSAAAVVRAQGVVGEGLLQIPRLLLVDDAQELGEGALGLIAACAAAGSAVWVFGDPDIATSAFRGERTAILARLSSELERRGAPVRELEQFASLEQVHRHGPAIRSFIANLTTRIGSAGVGAQRRAVSAFTGDDTERTSAGDAGGRAERVAGIEFASAGSPAEQLGVIAHRFRARHLGLDSESRVPWSEMAVICRSRGDAVRIARVLASHQVPTGIAAGGIVLREHRIVRELIRLLQHAMGLGGLAPNEVLELVGGVIGGLDPVAVRRLRGALLLQERRDAREAGREPMTIDELIADAFAFPEPEPAIDSAGGRALRRVGRVAEAGRRVMEAGGTPREVLWAIWDRTGLASRWQDEALDARGARGDEAGRSLDAVLGLFFALQRHEEQDSAQPIDELLDELLASAVPEDSLARSSDREAVTVTTPQGAIGREFSAVAVIGVQDGTWPNLRPRGSLLGGSALERGLAGQPPLPSTRRGTLHDELRLFVQAVSRARDEALVVAVSDETQHPGAFFGLGRDHLVTGLPSARLTLRGATSEMRRRLARDPQDGEALRSLVALAEAGVPGAAPDEWYGVRQPSSASPLVDLAGDPELRVPLSPSQLERAEECPLDWVIARLGGGTGNVQASIGTLVHHAFETVDGPDIETMLAAVAAEWEKLPFDADWESERARRLAGSMIDGLAAYLGEFEASDRRLLGREVPFAVEIDRAVLRGIADRLEARSAADGADEVTVVDLKTGRTPPSAPAAEQHAQLQAYQLGIIEDAFEAGEVTEEAVPSDPSAGEIRSGGARLLYVHPDATRGRGFVERAQQPLDEEAQQAFRRRVAEIALVCAGSEFTARVEHHCSDPHKPGNCRIHVIPAVSRS